MTRITYNAKEIYLASVLYDSIEDANLSAVTKLLAEKKANPNVLVPRKGISPFHLAIGCDDPKFAYDVTLLILKHDGNPNTRSLDGLTPVHIAAAWGRIDILQVLLNCGGDPYLKDANHMSAIDYSYDQNQKEIAMFFRENFPAVDISAITEKDEDTTVCDIVLDKILVNNGDVTGEYLVDQSYSNEDENVLQSLPLADSKQYVLNWIDTVIPEEEEKLDEIKSEILTTSSESDDIGETTLHPNVTRRQKFHTPRTFIKNETQDSLLELENTRILPSSRESGINTLPDSMLNTFNESLSLNKTEKDVFVSFKEQIEKQKDTSSDYFTCTDTSEDINLLDKNISKISSDISLPVMDNNSIMTSDRSMMRNSNVNVNNDTLFEKSFVSVSEVYKYLDPQEGVVLYEKRLLVTPTLNLEDSIHSAITSQSSAVSSLPQNFDYDTDCLRTELVTNGIYPGPITKTTKRIYLKKLYKLKKCPTFISKPLEEKTQERVYSKELEQTLRNPDWENDLVVYRDLDLIVAKEFGNPDPSRKWREGVSKSSFNYLLLDPRVTQNLPCRIETMTREEVWKTFLKSIFYVGKGKRSRPYSHLYEALNLWNCGSRTSKNAKLQMILDIWSENCGVVCLHIFQNVIPVEAYTREAAMINALKLINLKNVKAGDFYGQASTWTNSEKCKFGTFLLVRALNILLQEGERQLSPRDID